jgi:transglutaminase-like putative cysteine protease
MIYRVTHTTTYAYSQPVSLCHNLLHLTPRATARQRCITNSMEVAPRPAIESFHSDFFGNAAAFLTIQEPHRRLTVTARCLIEVTPSTPPVPEDTPPWEEVRASLPSSRDRDGLEAAQFVFDSAYIKASAELTAYVLPSFPPDRPLLDAVLDLTERIHTDFRYDPTATTVATPLADVLANRRGVCQDFAHLQIGCLRSLGLAARYVSGYLLTQPPPGQPRLVGADASHAWPSVYCPGHGWLDVDPTNNQIPSEKHITLAWGRDYDDVSPVKGVILGGGEHGVSVAVDVIPADGGSIQA